MYASFSVSVQVAVHLRSRTAAVGTAFLSEPMDLPGNKSTPGKNPPWTLLCLLVGFYFCLSGFLFKLSGLYCMSFTKLDLWPIYLPTYLPIDYDCWANYDLSITSCPTKLDDILSGLDQLVSVDTIKQYVVFNDSNNLSSDPVNASISH